MEKLDLRKQLGELYQATEGRPAIVVAEPAGYLMIEGRGDPYKSAAYKAASQALHALAYALKVASKTRGGPDYSVMPLESLWWIPDMSRSLSAPKDSRLWTAMIRQPDFISAEDVADAKTAVRGKQKGGPALEAVELKILHEGMAAQVLYIGPYADEAPAGTALHDWIDANGYESIGKHHEIYLSDPGRTAAEKLKTIIRHPVKKI